MKLLSLFLCIFIMNITVAANCNQSDVNRCLDTAYEGLDQNLADYGFDPNTAGIEDPTATCRANSPYVRYNWGYITFGGIVDFQGVTLVDPRNGQCQHVTTTLRWMGSNL